MALVTSYDQAKIDELLSDLQTWASTNLASITEPIAVTAQAAADAAQADADSAISSAAAAQASADAAQDYAELHGVIVCTSGTRPSTPFEGMVIYETNTDKIQVYTGSIWVTAAYCGALDTWTPAYTNLTVGNGIVKAEYSKIGKRVRGIWSLSLGSTSSFSGGIIIGLPVTGEHARRQLAAGASAYDNSPAQYYMLAGHLDATTITPRAFSGTNGAQTSVNATVPFTWTTSDLITIEFDYQAATAETV